MKKQFEAGRYMAVYSEASEYWNVTNVDTNHHVTRIYEDSGDMLFTDDEVTFSKADLQAIISLSDMIHKQYVAIND